jgi:hypothetical protein
MDHRPCCAATEVVVEFVMQVESAECAWLFMKLPFSSMSVWEVM